MCTSSTTWVWVNNANGVNIFFVELILQLKLIADNFQTKPFSTVLLLRIVHNKVWKPIFVVQHFSCKNCDDRKSMNDSYIYYRFQFSRWYFHFLSTLFFHSDAISSNVLTKKQYILMFRPITRSQLCWGKAQNIWSNLFLYSKLFCTFLHKTHF